MIAPAALALVLAVARPTPPAKGPPAAKPAAPATVGCVECHLALDDTLLTPPAKAFADDIHARNGFTCVFCHGGDPAALDQDVAHDRRKGFRGRIAPTEVPEVCGKCHADAALMKQPPLSGSAPEWAV